MNLPLIATVIASAGALGVVVWLLATLGRALVQRSLSLTICGSPCGPLAFKVRDPPTSDDR